MDMGMSVGMGWDVTKVEWRAAITTFDVFQRSKA